ncbi:MAG TPA: hypothetical protein VIH99_06065 [Bdellovibrionota bacterium]|jgi:hypothetical protein
MKAKIFLLPVVFLSLNAYSQDQTRDQTQDQAVRCEYFYQVMPVTQLEIGFASNGTLNPAVRVFMQGNSHLESIEAVEAREGESLHAWISKGTENEIEMVVYKNPVNNYNSKITNHAVPFGKDLWGNCAAKP